MAGWVAGAVAVISAAAIAGTAMVVSAKMSADAQQQVAETNARATVQAAQEAAHAQIESATQDAKARMHESDVAFNQDQEYLKFEKWAMAHEDDQDTYYRSMQNDIDNIDTFYAEDSASWGVGVAEPYDYGDGGGAGVNV
jgi:hypothetical protein